MAMTPHNCKDCIHHQARLREIIMEDGQETPIIDHYCRRDGSERLQPRAELEFGCGLYREG